MALNVISPALLSHDTMCQSPIYNDTRWDVRPQHFRRGSPEDFEWIKTPLQPPYLATDTPHMSYNLNVYKNAQGGLKPEVTPDPCIPYHTQYCSFDRKAWTYDISQPSLVLPPRKCALYAKSTVPDVACMDQSNLMGRDLLAKNIQQIKQYEAIRDIEQNLKRNV